MKTSRLSSRKLLSRTVTLSSDSSPAIGKVDGPAPASRDSFRKPSDIGEDELLETLREHRWQLKPAADALGVSRATMYRLVDSSPRIRKATEVDPAEIEQALERSGGHVGKAAASLEVSPQGLKRRMKALGMTEQPTRST